MFSVENVVVDYYPDLANTDRFTTRKLVSFLRYLFHESEIQQFEQKYSHLAGFDFIEQVLNHFDFGYRVRDRDIERIPANGRLVIIANHPLGTLDGLVLLKLVRKVRPDVKVVANVMLTSLQAMQPVLLPVDNINSKTSRDSLKKISAYLEAEGAVIMFPAGEVSRMGPQGIKDGKWNRGFLRIASQYSAPILPVHVNGRNSLVFYALSFLARPLSGLWLVHEMFKQGSNSVEIKIGEKIDYSEYSSIELGLNEKVTLFKRHLYRIGKDRKPLFRTRASIAHPEDTRLVRKELNDCEYLGATDDNKQIYLYRFRHDSAIMREIGRLRELSFRAVGEGTLDKRDIDRYDSHYMHLLLWDSEELEIAGAYRLCDASMTLSTHGIDGLYTSSLFYFNQDMIRYCHRGLELGRSFVQPKYWGRRSLDYLWFGIGALLRKNPQYRYLFGPVSISDLYSSEAKEILVHFYRHYFGSDDRPARALSPFTILEPRQRELDAAFNGGDYREDFRRMKAMLADLGYTVPTLFKQYTEVCEQGGVMFSDFNIDRNFSDCIDGFVIVDIERLRPAKRQRYLGESASVLRILDRKTA